MEFVAATCEKCSGELRIPAGRERLLCNYCGSRLPLQVRSTPYLLNGNRNGDGRVSKLLVLAEIAQYVGNQQEASEYYSRVLEIDPSSHKALLGKGITAARLSRPGNFRAAELVKYCELAFAGLPETESDELRDTAAEQILNVCIDARTDVPDSEVNGEMQKLLKCLEYAQRLSPGNANVLEALYYQHSYLEYCGNEDFLHRKEELLDLLEEAAPERAADLKSQLEQAISEEREKVRAEEREKTERARMWEQHALEIERQQRLKRKQRIQRNVGTGFVALVVLGLVALLCFAFQPDSGPRQDVPAPIERTDAAGPGN